MATTTHPIGGAWADGEAVVQTGQSIEFEGTVTGVETTVWMRFNADDEATYRLAEGNVDGLANESAKGLVVKHVEMALMDAGFTIDPVAASPDYEP